MASLKLICLYLFFIFYFLFFVFVCSFSFLFFFPFHLRRNLSVGWNFGPCPLLTGEQSPIFKGARCDGSRTPGSEGGI